MTAHARYRKLVALAVGAIVAPLLVVATTTAPAEARSWKHKHDVTMYKIERDIRLAGGGDHSPSGQVTSTSLSCRGSDSVLDGMWKVSSVDQYNPDPVDPDDDEDFPGSYTGGAYNDARDVFVHHSYASSSNSWAFKFENLAYGDAQLKAYITCIEAKTERNGHAHRIKTTDTSWSDAAAPDQAVGLGGGYHASLTCSPTQFFVAPGFKINSGTTRLAASHPLENGRSWRWIFNSTTAADVDFYGKCIDRKVAAANGFGSHHQHAIKMRHLPLASEGANTKSISSGSPQDVQFSCDEKSASRSGHKAMVGAFYLHHPHTTWFLGMEPRPKTRVFRFFNSGGTSKVDLGILCVNSRTGNPLR
ncbi:MAG: hypothetical protein WBP61_11005 [Nocardioides sp.]